MSKDTPTAKPDVDILKTIDAKLDAIIVNQNKQNMEIEELKNEILSLKKALLERMEISEKPKKAEWKKSKSGTSEWIPASDCDPEFLKQISSKQWKKIGGYSYRLTEDGERVIRVRSGKK